MPADADSFSLDLELPPGDPMLDPPVVRVYLASALTNLNEIEKAEAAQGRAFIRDVFQNYDYFGVRFEVYDPAEVTPPGSNHSSEEVYLTDHHHTSKADLVLFYVLAPSLGVGMEAQIAADCTLPRVVVSRCGAPVSRMFQGAFSPTIASIEYGEVSELQNALSAQLLTIAAATVESARRRRSSVDGFCKDSLGKNIMACRLRIGMPLRELANLTDIRESWLQRIEFDPSLAPSVTFIAFHRIASVLRVSAEVTQNGFPTIRNPQSDDQMSDVERESLNNLVDFARNHDRVCDDNLILSLWETYRSHAAEETSENLAHRGGKPLAFTVDEWKRRYESMDGRLF